jgi:tryptophanyl-tRNA synthetase
MKIDAWGSNKIENYKHVFNEFGLKEFNASRISSHYLFQRGIIIAERDFNKVLDAIRNNKTFLQMTGIASSGPMHFGHKVDIDLFLEFKTLGAKSKFCVADIDAYTSRPDSKIPSMNKAKEIAIDNVADLLALGLSNEDIYVQSQMPKQYYEFAFALAKKITQNNFEAIYGHVDLGKISAVLLQIADILHIQLPFMFNKAPSITGIGLDQDPHARITRDIARKLGLELPSFFYFIHQSGLKEGQKMSSSEPDTAIFLKDNPLEVKKKINKAFTGGRETIEEQKMLGGEPEKCKIFEMFKFHHPDTGYVEKVKTECKQGKRLCGQCKAEAIEFINGFLSEHQKKKSQNKDLAREIVLGND